MINNYKPIWREEIKEGSILCSNCGVLLDWSD